MVLAAILFGIWPSLSKLVLKDVHPLVIGFLIQLIPGLALSPTLRRVRISRSDLKLLLLSSVAGSVVAPVLYLYGLQKTTASNSVFLSNTEALFTMLLAYAILSERATRREYVALGGIAIGAFLVTTQLRFGDVRFAEFLIGNVMLVAAAACWAVSNTLSTVLLRRISIGPLAAGQLLIGAAIFSVIVPVAGVPFAVPFDVWPLIILLSLCAIGGFAVLFYYAFRTIGAMRTGAILPTSAFWGILLAIYLFHDTLSDVQIAGGVLMIAAVVVLYVSRGPAETKSEGETLKPAASDGPDSLDADGPK